MVYSLAFRAGTLRDRVAQMLTSHGSTCVELHHVDFMQWHSGKLSEAIVSGNRQEIF